MIVKLHIFNNSMRNLAARQSGRIPISKEFHMPRKVFVVNDEIRERVRSLASVGVRQDDIAGSIGCDSKTLRKHFRDELDRGTAEANAEITGYLFATAKAGNVIAQIFWLKTRAHWRECQAPEDPTPGTDAEATSHMVILPDNNRDPVLTEELRKAQQKYFNRKQRQRRQLER
jgi:hypothetical protein